MEISNYPISYKNEIKLQIKLYITNNLRTGLDLTWFTAPKIYIHYSNKHEKIIKANDFSEIPLLRPPKIKTSIKNLICKV